MMDKCPYCSAETRPGDNFCLNCGNRLLPADSSPQQSQPGIGDATIPAQDDWMASMQGAGAAPPSESWSDVNAQTLVGPSPEQTTARPEPSPVAQATMNKIEEPARFILRADNGEVLQEYPLEKFEITIGRAPTSDILLSKDKLISRRHATVRYENGNYVLRDERSANGTFVNGQQLEEKVPRALQDGDHVGIGEHELVFRTFQSASVGIEDLPTVAVKFEPAEELTYRTRDDELATAATSDDYGTKSMDNGSSAPVVTPPPIQPASPPAPEPVPSMTSAPPSPVLQTAAVSSEATPQTKETSSGTPVAAPVPAAVSDAGVTFGRLTSLPLPTLPDIAPLMAALSTLDGQVMSLQEQLNATQDALRNHEAEIAQTTKQLRTGVLRVSERMDNTIADVARSREALAWAELLQLMEDVMNNPRDIEYVTKLARKARELNKVFQIHQNVLNTLAECNSLLRGLIGEEK